MIVDVKCPRCQAVNSTTLVLNVDSNPLELMHCSECHLPFCFSLVLRPDVTTYTLEMVRKDRGESTEPVEEPAPSSPVETPLQVEQEPPEIEQSTSDEPEADEEIEQIASTDAHGGKIPNTNVTYLLRDDLVSLRYNGYSKETYGMDVIHTLLDMSDNERNIEIKDMLKDERSKNSKISALKHFIAAVDSGEVSL